MNNSSTVDGISFSIAKWIHVRLKSTGKVEMNEVIHATDIDPNLKPLLMNALYGLVTDGLLFIEKTYNEETQKDEKTFYSKNVVI